MTKDRSTLIARLRMLRLDGTEPADTMLEAADEIERLQHEVSELRDMCYAAEPQEPK